jgi:cbb3-type cytochrome oxidase subunit 3
MYKYILQSVENINWLAMAALVLFFVIFVASTVWIMTKRKGYIEYMSNLPLEEDQTT